MKVCCAYDGETHASEQCPKPRSERRAAARQRALCFNCLNVSSKCKGASDCRLPSQCDHCCSYPNTVKHHFTLCVNRLNPIVAAEIQKAGTAKFSRPPFPKKRKTEGEGETKLPGQVNWKELKKQNLSSCNLSQESVLSITEMLAKKLKESSEPHLAAIATAIAAAEKPQEEAKNCAGAPTSSLG